jgi:hypothetical protein
MPGVQPWWQGKDLMGSMLRSRSTLRLHVHHNESVSQSSLLACGYGLCVNAVKRKT